MAMTDALRVAARTLKPSAAVTLATGETLSLEAADIVSIEIREGADSALTPGCVLSASYVLVLDNANGRWLPAANAGGRCPLEGAAVQLYLNALDGETWRRAPMGMFTVGGVSACEQQPVIRLTGSDSIASALALPFSDTLDYPSDLGQLWRHAVAQSGYAWEGSVPNGGAVIDAKPDWGDISLRQVMGYIAAAAGCFVQVDREGALQLMACRRLTPQAALAPDVYMRLTQGFEPFGPVNGLKVVPVPDAERSQVPLTVYSNGGAGEVLSVEGNLLFMQGAPHLQALAEGMLSQLSDLRLTKAEFRWRGDPAVGVGARIQLTDTRGDVHAVTVTRQTLRYDGGFSATCACEVPGAGTGGVRRLITPSGGLDAGALVGTVDGGLIRAGSITAREIAAGTITAGHLAAGTIAAQAIEAVRAHIGQLVSDEITTDALYAALASIAAAEIAQATIECAQISDLAVEVATIASAQITTATIREANIDWGAIANLTAQIATIAQAQVGEVNIEQADIDWASIESLNAQIASIAQAQIASASIGTAQVADLTAQIATIVTLAAQSGDFDFAAVRSLVAGAMVLSQGVGGSVTIENLAATAAMFAQATLGELVLKGDDDKYYRVTVSAGGGVEAEEVAVRVGEIASGRMADGRPIVETQAHIADLSAGTLRAQSAVIAGLFTAALEAGSITAGQAFLASAAIPELRVTAIRALSDTLELSANESVRAVVGGAVDEAVGGIRVGSRNYMRHSQNMLAPELHRFVARQAFLSAPVADECFADDFYAAGE